MYDPLGAVRSHALSLLLSYFAAAAEPSVNVAGVVPTDNKTIGLGVGLAVGGPGSLEYCTSNPERCTSPSDVKRTSIVWLLETCVAGTVEPENIPSSVALVLEPS